TPTTTACTITTPTLNRCVTRHPPSRDFLSSPFPSRRRGRGPGREGTALHHLAVQGMAEPLLQPPGRRDEGLQVHSRGHAHALQHVHQILSGDVAGGPGRKGAAAGA